MSGMTGACVSEKKDSVLSKEEMTNFMIEVYLGEARLASSGIFIPDSAKRIFESYDKALLSRRGISDSVLKKSYQYYAEHPDEMAQILDAVIDSLSLKEQGGGQLNKLK